MPLKIAMIGTGRIAENKLLPALDKTAKAVLWSVLSRDKARAGEMRKPLFALRVRPPPTTIWQVSWPTPNSTPS